jgi:hypothetical protein
MLTAQSSVQSYETHAVEAHVPAWEEIARSTLRACRRSLRAGAGFLALRAGGEIPHDLLIVDGRGMPLALRRELREMAYRAAGPVCLMETATGRDGAVPPEPPGGLESVLLIPLIAHGAAFGVVALGGKPEGFSPGDVEAARALGRSVAEALYGHLVVASPLPSLDAPFPMTSMEVAA